MGDSVNRITKKAECHSGCGHTEAEHEAFDAGLAAGLAGNSMCPFSGSLAHDWWTGHSVGVIRRAFRRCGNHPYKGIA